MASISQAPHKRQEIDNTLATYPSTRDVRHAASRAACYDVGNREQEIHHHFHRRITEIFDRYGVNTPSVRAVARILPDEPTLPEAVRRTGYSDATIRRAVKRLSGLWLLDRRYPLAELETPSHLGRGYEARIRCPAKLVALRECARSQPPPEDVDVNTCRAELLQSLGHKSGEDLQIRRREEGLNGGSHNQDHPRYTVGHAIEKHPDATLVQGSRFAREAASHLRRQLWEWGCDRDSSDLIVSCVLRRAFGQPLDYLRQLATALNEWTDVIVRRVQSAPDRAKAFSRINGILNRAMSPETDPLDDAGYDLSVESGRLAFSSRAREVASAGGGPCPRCGEKITSELLSKPWLTFAVEGLCSCIHLTVTLHTGSTPPRPRRQRRRHLDFNKAADRREILDQTGKKCFHCGKEITAQLRDNYGLAYEDGFEHLCKCLYAAAAKRSEAIEARHEQSKRSRSVAEQIIGAELSRRERESAPEPTQPDVGSSSPDPLRQLSGTPRRLAQNLNRAVIEGREGEADRIRERLRGFGLAEEMIAEVEMASTALE